MAHGDLTQTAIIQLSAGHLLVVWDVLANKVTETGFVDALTDEEKRAIWALQDLCERGLIDAGIAARPQDEWEALMQEARDHVKSVPVECLNDDPANAMAK